MKGILGYLRGFIGLREDDTPSLCSKRYRDQDDDPPVMKKYKTVRSHFPKIVMPSDEEEWTVPKRVGGGHRVHYIPISREDVLPNTSTPTAHVFENTRNLVKPFENYDFGKSLEPSTSGLNAPTWKRPTKLAQRPIIRRPDMPSVLLENSIAKSSVPEKSSSLLRDDMADRSAAIEAAYQRRFFDNSASKVTRFHTSQNEDVDDDILKFEVISESPRERKFFKSKTSPIQYKKSTKSDDVIVLSDSEDYDVILLKRRNKGNSDECNGNSSSHRCDDGFDESDLSDQPCTFCKPRLSDSGRPSFRRSLSPRTSRQTIGRFKTPLTLSKAMRLNSFTPFWKSQKTIGNSQTKLSSKRMSASRLPETTRAVIEKCFRLDDKKRYEELIRLSSTSFLRNKSNKPSHLDLSETQQRIRDLTSSINLSQDSIQQGKDRDIDHKLHNGTLDKDSPEEPIPTVVLSDSDPEQVASADDASTSSSVRIVPVNSLRTSFRERPLVNSNWMEDLNRRYKNIQLEKKQEEKDCIIVSTTQSKVNRASWLNRKQQEIKALKVYDLTDEPEEIEEIPLPELTEQQQMIINNALRPNPPNQVLIEKFNLSIHRRDIQTLAGLNWLNDEVINFYMNLLMERGQQSKDLPKVYGMNTFFYPKLMQSGHAGLKRWTRKVDIFSHDLMLVPVHLGIHWCMSIIDFRKKTIRYFDSMGGKNMECCDALLRYLVDECMDKKREKFHTADWEKECVKDIPQQMNGSDCGMFSCTFAEFISRDAPITFSQNDMPYLRRKMILEIVQGKLLL